MPQTNNDKPLDVKIGFYIESLGNFRSTEMAFDVDLYVYTSWKDASMSHNETGYILINDKNVLDRMWVPDLYFANARTAYFHDVTVPNFNMFIDKDGVISYGTRVTLTVACNLILKNYPLDKQTCSIKIISYAHVKQEMNVTWFSEGSVRYNPEIGLPEFKIMAITSDYCNGTFHYTITDTSSRIGDFSCLLGLIDLERAIGYHIVQSYLPNAAIVIISWVSFWFALVNSYMRRANKYNNLAQSMRWSTPGIYNHPETDTDTEDDPLRRHKLGNFVSQPELVYKAMFFNRRALAVDQISRAAFPGAFACFNLVYWYYYLYYSNSVES
uniref:Ig-like domain-containing protein n=1 Tax=Panagrolaimus sp. ES5 TaxID=591445 RepID=A0AC34F9G5_9BILA